MLPPKRGRDRKDEIVRLPYINAENLRGTEHECTLQRVILERTPYSDYTLRVVMDGEEWNMGINTNNPNHDLLIDALGQDETKWVTGTKFFVRPVFRHTLNAEVVEINFSPQGAQPLTEMMGDTPVNNSRNDPRDPRFSAAAAATVPDNPKKE